MDMDTSMTNKKNITSKRGQFLVAALICVVGGFIATPAQAMISQSGYSNTVANIQLPSHIPAQCVAAAAQRYQIPELALLSILKQESGGRLGIVSKNTNGSKDYGPAQFNDRSWGRYMRQNYNISLDDLTNNMCQALMAQAYALRSEWNRCIKKGKNSVWCAIAYYHSPTKKHQDRYVNGVWKQYQSIVKKGKF